MRIGERHGRNFVSSSEPADELTPQDMILDSVALDDDEAGIPTIRRGGNPRAPRSHNTLIPPPSRSGGDDAVDFASLLHETPAPLSFRSIDFDETPMPTSANTTGSVAPVSVGLNDQDEDDWIEEQLRHSIRPRPKWPYALAAVAGLGIGLVALSGWTPSWKQPASAVTTAPAVAAIVATGTPVYRADDLPVAGGSDDPEEVYLGIQRQLQEEARQTEIETARREGREERERSRTESEQVIDHPEAAETPEPISPSNDTPEGTAADSTAPSEAEQPVEQPPPFDPDAANTALAAAAGAAAACRGEGVPGGQVVRVAVTFAPSGRVNSAQLTEGTLLGTAAGSCVARAFRSARVSAFSGPMVTVHKTVRLD